MKRRKVPKKDRRFSAAVKVRSNDTTDSLYHWNRNFESGITKAIKLLERLRKDHRKNPTDFEKSVSDISITVHYFAPTGWEYFLG